MKLSFLFLFAVSLMVSLGSDYFLSALGIAATPNPTTIVEVAQCLPDLTKNKVDLSATYKVGDQTYYQIQVKPLPSEVEALMQTEADYPIPPWELIVVRKAQEPCQSLTSVQSLDPTNSVPEAARRQLRLEQFRNRIKQVGLRDFRAEVFGGLDDYHGGDQPEGGEKVAPDAAWALQQLGISGK